MDQERRTEERIESPEEILASPSLCERTESEATSDL